jgi:hypothetical protein
MISSKSPEGLGPNAAGAEAVKVRKSIRFRRGPVVAIVSAAVLWAGLMVLWRLL